MEKKYIILGLIGIIIVLPIAYYLLSPLWRVVQVNEESPLEVKDAMATMNAETKEKFEAAVLEANKTVMLMDEKMPAGPRILATGVFKPNAHEVDGRALIIDADGRKFLRFENFYTINGPDLRIYLASDLSARDFIELGKIKATKGNVNYELPEGVDLSKYNKVLVWCKPFGVLFSSAVLS